MRRGVIAVASVLLVLGSASPAPVAAATGNDADLVATASATASVRLADAITYGFTAANLGPSSARGVTVRAILPAGVRYVSDDRGGVAFGQQIEWTLSRLDAGTTFTVTVSATAPKLPGKVSASLSLASDKPDPNPSNSTAFATTEVRKPNFVVVMTDDQTLAQMQALPLTQELVGGAGTTFSDFMVSYPLCCPSRATYLTGQYAAHHGVLSNYPPLGGYPALDGTNTLPVWLHDAGYHTVHIGKYLNGWGASHSTEIPLGWDDFQGTVEQASYDYSINDNGTFVTYGHDPADYQDDVIADRAVRAIQTSAATGQPFFVNVAVHSPHTEPGGGPTVAAPRYAGSHADTPLPMPPSFDEVDVSDKPPLIQQLPRLSPSDIDEVTQSWRAALDSLMSVDELDQRLIQTLASVGQLDNTVFMFTSDNGFQYGEHRIDKGKNVPYDESLHLPLLMRGPSIPVGATVDSLVGNIDLAPTITAMAGATARRVPDGVNLQNVMAAPESYTNRAILVEGYSGTACFTGMRDARYTYVQEPLASTVELYDRVVDPWELNNVATDPSYSSVRTVLETSRSSLLPSGTPGCGAGVAVVNVGDVTVPESGAGNVQASIPVTLNNPVFDDVVVSYQTETQTAGASDYKIAATGTVLIRAGDVRTTIPFWVKNDVVTEGLESFRIRLTATSSDKVAVSRAVGTVTILDRSPDSTIDVGDAAVVEGDYITSGDRRVCAEIPLVLASAQPVDTTFTYQLVSETANSGDYVKRSGQRTIPAGQTTTKVFGCVRPDAWDETDETFRVKLSAATPGVMIGRVGTVTILDDDGL